MNINKDDINIFIIDTWQKYAGDMNFAFDLLECNIKLHKSTSSSCSMSPEC